MQQIPIQAVASQIIHVVLGQQDCQISLYQKSTGIFFDLIVQGKTIVTTRLARNAVALVRQQYLGFTGDLVLVDMQGNNDPEYTGLGTRYLLFYLEAGEQ